MTARLAVALLPLLLVATVAAGPRLRPALVGAPNADGMAVTLSAGGGVTADHPFSRGFGESGRASLRVTSGRWLVARAWHRPHDRARSARAGHRRRERARAPAAPRS